MATTLANSHAEHALALIRTYVPAYVRENWRIVGTCAIMLCLCLCPVVAALRESYLQYLAVVSSGGGNGGGVLRNLLGWTRQGLQQPFARHDVRDPAPLRDPKLQPIFGEPHGRTCFISGGNLVPRRGDRPVVPGFVAPQRQTSDLGPSNAEMRERLIAYQRGIARSNGSVLRAVGDSLVSVWFPSYLRRTKGEFAHVNPEASMHVVLSLVDAEEVVRMGWGERHPLSGVYFPWTYIMVYAPRDEDEFEVCRRIADASVRFVCAGGNCKLSL